MISAGHSQPLRDALGFGSNAQSLSVPPIWRLLVEYFREIGSSVIGWADDLIGDRPPAALVVGSVSARTFPVKV
jgi:hypothetical protein